jgi:hypothetical protein
MRSVTEDVDLAARRPPVEISVPASITAPVLRNTMASGDEVGETVSARRRTPPVAVAGRRKVRRRKAAMLVNCPFVRIASDLSGGND